MSDGWLNDADMPDYKHTHISTGDGSPAMLLSEDEATITLVNEEGYWWVDEKHTWASIADGAVFYDAEAELEWSWSKVEAIIERYQNLELTGDDAVQKIIKVIEQHEINKP